MLFLESVLAKFNASILSNMKKGRLFVQCLVDADRHRRKEEQRLCIPLFCGLKFKWLSLLHVSMFRAHYSVSGYPRLLGFLGHEDIMRVDAYPVLFSRLNSRHMM